MGIPGDVAIGNRLLLSSGCRALVKRVGTKISGFWEVCGGKIGTDGEIHPFFSVRLTF